MYPLQLSDWVKDKYKTATDESYRDLTNLLPKLQKHQAFEAELKANKEILGQVNEVDIQFFIIMTIYWLIWYLSNILTFKQ